AADPAPWTATIGATAIIGPAHPTITYPQVGLLSLVISGGQGDDRFTVAGIPSAGLPSGGVGVSGGGGRNTLQGPNGPNGWVIGGADHGTLTPAPVRPDRYISFNSIQNLVGGTAAETFTFQDAGSISGTLDGGGGADTLDYSQIHGVIIADL